MAILTVHQGHKTIKYTFSAPASLSELLAHTGSSISHPCGGRGVCGKCAVVIDGVVSEPNAAEQRCGVRLACQTIIHGDASITLPQMLPMTQIAGGKQETISPTAPMSGKIGAAVDIGTTTLALLLYDLNNGRCLGAASMLNPQTAVAADVIGRIDAAMKGRACELQHQISSAINALMTSACSQTDISPACVESIVLTGNTTMLYLLTGKDPAALSHAPFRADCLFGQEIHLKNRIAYLPDCMHAFVGADTTCALVASGMLEESATSLLCDVGTNGELALWHHGQLYIASTAAGPAFEGAGISCGCGSIPGAIDQVYAAEGKIHCTTIGGHQAIGLCGSGLVDAVAVMLEMELLDETGFMEEETLTLCDGIVLKQSDIRAVQLAKAATYAGIMSLLYAADCTCDQVEHVYMAGGFGSRLNICNAARIGLIPGDLTGKIKVLGNAALDGAAQLLMNTELRQKCSAIRTLAQHVRLDGNPCFAQCYVDAMLFPNNFT